MVVIWVYCGLIWKIVCPKMLQLPIVSTQFLNPGYDPEWKGLIINAHSDQKQPVNFDKISQAKA